MSVLIVPLWNWNRDRHTIMTAVGIVLIVPLWNWNSVGREVAFAFKRSNRTFMELKLLTLIGYLLSLLVLIVPLWNWNWFHLPQYRCPRNVLIVPLCNWNVQQLTNFIVKYGCSNCTFMELKSGSADGFLFGIARSNCTFMELKCLISHTVRNCCKVLKLYLYGIEIRI